MLWSQIGEPKYILGPMVGHSYMPFRLLTRKYNVQLAYTPMLHSRLYSESETYRKQHFSTCEADKPLFAQFCGNDPDLLMKAGKMIEPYVDALDINLGCPQFIARRGNYGSFLLDDPDLIERIIRHLKNNLSVPITCKIRKVSEKEEDTINLACRIENAGASAICLHGRTKEQKSQHTGESDKKLIYRLSEIIRIPVIANGGVSSLSDVKAYLSNHRVAAVMIAEAALSNPTFFSGNPYVLMGNVGMEYIQICENYESVPNDCIRSHLIKMFYRHYRNDKALRDKLSKCSDFESYKDVCQYVLQNELAEQAPGNCEIHSHWYNRYRWYKTMCYQPYNQIYDYSIPSWFDI